MLTTIYEDNFPVWVLIFERLGPGSAILVFTGAVLWKLLPASINLIRARAKQSDRITEAVPHVLEGVKDLVRHAERVADHVTGVPATSRGSAAVRVLRRTSDRHSDASREES